MNWTLGVWEFISLIKVQRSSRIPTECFSWFRDEYRSIKSFFFLWCWISILYLSIYWCLFGSKSWERQTRRMHILFWAVWSSCGGNITQNSIQIFFQTQVYSTYMVNVYNSTLFQLNSKTVLNLVLKHALKSPTFLSKNTSQFLLK